MDEHGRKAHGMPRMKEEVDKDVERPCWHQWRLGQMVQKKNEGGCNICRPSKPQVWQKWDN